MKTKKVCPVCGKRGMFKGFTPDRPPREMYICLESQGGCGWIQGAKVKAL